MKLLNLLETVGIVAVILYMAVLIYVGQNLLAAAAGGGFVVGHLVSMIVRPRGH